MNIGILLAALGVGAFALMGKKKASEDVVSAPPKKKKPVASQQAAEPATPKSKYRMVIWTDLDPPPANGRFVQDLASVGIRLAKVVKVNPKTFFQQWIHAEFNAVSRLVVTNKEPTIAVFAFSRPVEEMLWSVGATWLTEERMYQQLQEASHVGLNNLGTKGIVLIGEGGDSSGATEFGNSGIRVLRFDQWLGQEQPWSEKMADDLVVSLINDTIPR
jgi:hypothetical protein